MLLSLPAYAKLNLCLAVAPPEPADGPQGPARAGWHRIASWMSCIDLHDDVTIERLPEGADSAYDIAWAADAPKPPRTARSPVVAPGGPPAAAPVDWPLDKDLAVRAHRALEARAARPLPARVTVRKRTPTGGGLGGGSSDAASVLIALHALFASELAAAGVTAADVRAVGQRLGSDVGFFLDEDLLAQAAIHVARTRAEGLASPRLDAAPRPAIVEGFGERVERVARVPSDVLLVIPPVECPTPAVYRAFDAAPHPRPGVAPERLADAVRAAHAQSLAAGVVLDRALFNDLAPAASAVAPSLRDLADAFANCAASAPPLHLTGSGSCHFLLVAPGRTPQLASAARAALADQPALASCVLLQSRLV